MTKKKIFLKWACAITGDDFDLLVQEAVPSRRKVLLLAYSAFLPTFTWAVTGYLLAYKILNFNQINALFTSLVLAFLIFSLERIIIMSPKSKLLFGARFLLGGIIALLGAFITDSVIFHNDLMGHLNEMKIAAGNQAEDREKLKLLHEQARLDSLMALMHNNWQNALAAAAAEADGTGGSGRKGVDAITRLKLQNASRLEKEYLNARDQRNLFERYKEARIKEARQKAEKTFENPGLLTMAKATVQFVVTDSVVLFVYFLFLSLIILIEIIPVSLKFYLHETTYDEKIRIMEEVSLRRLEMVLNPPLMLKFFTKGRTNNIEAQHFN